MIFFSLPFGRWWSIVILLFFSWSAKSQAVANSAGNWDNSSIWNGANIGDNLETVTFSNSIGAVVLRDGYSYTVGTISMGNSNTLTVNGILNIGDNANPANLTANNGCTITIGSSGEVTIWGNLTAFNNLSFGLGKLTIKGNLDVKNGADINIVGTVQIDGDFLADNNTTVNIGASGNLNVDGQYSVGTGSVMTGTGTATGDPCSGPAAFCIFSPLPVELVSFEGNQRYNTVELNWVTGSELNNDYFEIERSLDGKNFNVIGKIQGNGTSKTVNSYMFEDHIAVNYPVYYRLNQVDFDGSNSYSKIIVIYGGRRIENEVVIYPNPGASKIRIATSEKLYKLCVLDINGKKVVDLSDEESFNIPESIKPGIYFLSFQRLNGRLEQIKFVKM